MEIKDTNTSLSQLLLGKNGQAQSSASGVEAKGAFANLLNGASSAVEEMMQSLSASKNAAPAAKADAKDVPLKAAPKDKPENKVNNKEQAPAEKAPAKENKQAKRKDKEVAEVAPQQAEKPAAKEVVKTADTAVEAVAVAEESALPQAVEENVSAKSQQIQSILEVADKLGLVGVLNGGQMMLVPAEDMRTMDPNQMVQVFDIAQGKVVEMSVADLLAKTSSQNATLNVVPAEDFVADLDAASLAKVLTKLSADEQSAIKLPTNNQAVQYTNAELAAQAAKLDEKIGGLENVSVEVDVAQDEAKIAHSTRDLISDDSADLQEFLEAVKTPITKLSEKVEKQKELDSLKSEAPQDPAVANQALAPNAAPIIAPTVDLKAAVLAPQMVDETDIAVKVVALENNSALNTIGASAQALKPELAAKAEETSLKDIYKGMGKEVVEQIKVNITKSAVQGVDKIDVRLKPEDLGHVQIKLQISKDGKLQAEIIAGRQETMQILQKEVESLQKAFNDAGFEADSGSFSFSFRGEEEQKQNSELRNFIGDVLEKEASQEVVSNDNSVWDPAQGLNIRV